MSAAYVIFSSNPNLCVQFYTRVLGLKNKKKRTITKNKKAEPFSKQKAEAVNSPDTSSDIRTPFLINHEYIEELSSIQDAPKNAVIETNRFKNPISVELYFIVKESLDDIFQRLKKGAFVGSSRVLQLEGVSNALRILHLYDPDGNKLRLVELV